MSRPSKLQKTTVGGQPSVNDSAPEVLNLTAAAASSECQTALVEGPAAARIALAKFRTSIFSALFGGRRSARARNVVYLNQHTLRRDAK
jgi:hypothetical protein